MNKVKFKDAFQMNISVYLWGILSLSALFLGIQIVFYAIPNIIYHGIQSINFQFFFQSLFTVYLPMLLLFTTSIIIFGSIACYRWLKAPKQIKLLSDGFVYGNQVILYDFIDDMDEIIYTDKKGNRKSSGRIKLLYQNKEYLIESKYYSSFYKIRKQIIDRNNSIHHIYLNKHQSVDLEYFRYKNNVLEVPTKYMNYEFSSKELSRYKKQKKYIHIDMNAIEKIYFECVELINIRRLIIYLKGSSLSICMTTDTLERTQQFIDELFVISANLSIPIDFNVASIQKYMKLKRGKHMIKKYIVVCGFGYLTRNFDTKKCKMKFNAYRTQYELIIEEGYLIFDDTNNEFGKLRELVQRDTIIVVEGEMTDKDIRVTRLLDEEVKNQEVLDFLTKQKQPRDFEDDRFGLIKEDMRFRDFNTTINYYEKKITLELRNRKSIEYAHKIEDFNMWIDQAKQFAASELLELGNDWCLNAWCDDGKSESEYVELKEEDFMQRITPTEVCFGEDGSGCIYFNDGNIFWGHVVVVYFKDQEFERAQMEG